MQDNAGRCYWHLLVPVYLNMSRVLLYKQMKGYYLKVNDADVSSVGPSSEWIRGLWVVCVCMGGGGGMLLVEKWWFRHKFLLMCIVLVLSHYDLIKIPHVARHIPFPALKMEPIYIVLAVAFSSRLKNVSYPSSKIKPHLLHPAKPMFGVSWQYSPTKMVPESAKNACSTEATISLYFFDGSDYQWSYLTPKAF